MKYQNEVHDTGSLESVGCGPWCNGGPDGQPSTGAAEAEPASPPERIVITSPAGMNPYGVAFVQDRMSGGCWIAAKANSNLSALAIAPPGACR